VNFEARIDELVEYAITVKKQGVLALEKEKITLTAREIQVLEQLSKGLKYDAIAENLILSKGTIRKHVENIYAKLQVHNKLEAVQIAKKNKLI
jgi:DNA-binding NarL/FixJ family response regulator